MDANGVRVLVVDDTEAQRYATARALRSFGFQVQEAATGNEALTLAQSQPDAILLDVNLPDIKGLEVCRQLKGNPSTARIPIIQFSAQESHDRVEDLRGDADDYILMPISFEELAAKLQLWTRVARAEGELRRKNAELESAQQDALFFANALKGSSQPFAAGFPDGRLWKFNQAFVDLTGYSAEELLSATWATDLTPPEWREPERQVLEVLHRTREPQIYEKEYIRKDGTRVPLEINVHLGRNADGSDYYYSFVSDISDRKRAQQALGDNETRFRSLFENSADAVFLTIPDGTITAANPAACAMFGMTEEEICRAGRDGLIDPTDERHAEAIKERNRAGRFTNLEMRYRRKGGECFIGEASSVVLPDNSSLHAFVTIRDITERKRAELELQSAKKAADTHLAQLRTTLENLVEAVYVCDEQGRPLLANPAFQRFTGCDLSALASDYEGIKKQFALFELNGKPAKDADRPTSAALRGEVVTGRVFRLAGQPGGDKIVSYNAAPVRDQHGNIIMAVISIEDITERKRAEMALQESEHRHRTLFESIDEGFCVIEMLFDGNDKPIDYRFLETNPSFDKQTGLVNAKGKRVKELAPGHEQHWFDIYGRIAKTGGPVRFQNRADQLHRWFDVYAFRYGRPEDRQVAVLFSDITEEKHAHEALIRSEKLASVGRMAATIAHEINNPLAAVMNTIYIAEKNADDPGAVREALQLADQELRRIAHLTRQTLGFYRESTAPAEFAVNEVADSAIDLLENKIKRKSIKVIRQYDQETRIVGMAGELRQVFSNLLTNSIDALEEKGTVSLRISRGRAVNNGDDCIRLTIADNGKGIPESVRAHIFEPFFTTKQAVGTGLGLWVTSEIIQKHGGSIRVHSCTNGPSRGTTFSIVLPAKAQARLQDRAV